MIAFAALNILNWKITVLLVKWKIQLSLVKIYMILVISFDFLSLSEKVTMKLYTCACLFDYYNYLLCCWGGFFVKGDICQKVHVGKTFTFTFSSQEFFVQTCYTCFFSLLKVKKLDTDDLYRVSGFYLSASTISRLQEYAKTWY